MNGYDQGAITGGIGKGINTAMSGIINLYGMQQRLDLQKQDLDIQKQNSATYHKMMHYNLASRFEREVGEDLSKWMTPSVRRPTPGGVGLPAHRLGLDASLELNPRYMQPGADALLD